MSVNPPIFDRSQKLSSFCMGCGEGAARPLDYCADCRAQAETEDSILPILLALGALAGAVWAYAHFFG